MSRIKNITPQLLCLGNIKIGIKGEMRTSRNKKQFQLPQKLDHFIITSQLRGSDGNFVPDNELMNQLKKNAGNSGRHSAVLDRNGNIIALPIRLLYNDPELNFPTRYAAYSGKQCVCTGNGEVGKTIKDQAVKCPCDWLTSDPPKCKPNGVLTCLIESAQAMGGCYKFRTTSINTIASMMGSMHLILAKSGGVLANVPLHLTIKPKTVQIPSGATSTIYVVSVVFMGSADSLQQYAFAAHKSIHTHANKMKQVAEKIIEDDFTNDDPESFIAEFYPDEFVRANGVDAVSANVSQKISDKVSGAKTEEKVEEKVVTAIGSIYNNLLSKAEKGGPDEKISESKLKEIGKIIKDRDYDIDGLKLAMQKYSIHRKDTGLSEPFRVDTLRDIKEKDADSFVEFLDSIEMHHDLMMRIRWYGKEIRDFEGFVKTSIAAENPPIKTPHWYCLRHADVAKINRLFSGMVDEAREIMESEYGAQKEEETRSNKDS